MDHSADHVVNRLERLEIAAEATRCFTGYPLVEESAGSQPRTATSLVQRRADGGIIDEAGVQADAGLVGLIQTSSET